MCTFYLSVSKKISLPIRNIYKKIAFSEKMQYGGLMLKDFCWNQPKVALKSSWNLHKETNGACLLNWAKQAEMITKGDVSCKKAKNS